MPTSVEYSIDHNDDDSEIEATAEEEEEDEWLISCRCDSARTIYNLLICLASVTSNNNTTSNNKRDAQSRKALQPVTIFCSPTGLTFHVAGAAKQLQASVDVPAEFFTDYHIIQQQQQRDDPKESNNAETAETNNNDWQAGGEFCLNLTTLLECLSVLSNTSNHSSEHHNNTPTQLACMYNLTQEVCKLELLQNDILCTTVIPGMQTPDLSQHNMALAFRSTDPVARIIYQQLPDHTSCLRHMVSELELCVGATIVTLSLDRRKGLQVAAVGTWGECCVVVPAKGNHVVSVDVAEQQPNTNISFSYHLHSLLASFKGLDIAKETCLTINESGMLAIQHQVVVEDNTPSFVDFIMCCLEEEEEDDEDGTEVVPSYQTRERFSLESHEASQSNTPMSQFSRRQHDGGDEEDSRRVSTSPKSRTANETTWWKNNADSSGSDGESDDNESRPQSSLFGQVTTTRARSRRSVRPKSARSSAEESKSEPGREESKSEEDSDDDESSVLLLSPPRRRVQHTNGGDSSPELFYGRQN